MKNKPTIKNDLKFSNKPWSMGTSASVTLETPVGSAPPKKRGVVEPRQVGKHIPTSNFLKMN
jgi:hypothetical protein